MLTPHPRTATPQAAYTSVVHAVEALQKGHMIILQDDSDRENEADLICAASKITPEIVNFMIQKACGLVCVALTEQRAQQLDLPLMLAHGNALHGTRFTVSVDAKQGVGTGISAPDRARTIALLSEEATQPDDLVRPGHIFPLIAHPEGLKARRGHTEGAVHLLQQTNLPAVAVIVEMLDTTGLALSGDALWQFASSHRLPVLHIQQLTA